MGWSEWIRFESWNDVAGNIEPPPAPDSGYGHGDVVYGEIDDTYGGNDTPYGGGS